jgi:hypothetical protein
MLGEAAGSIFAVKLERVGSTAIEFYRSAMLSRYSAMGLRDSHTAEARGQSVLRLGSLLLAHNCTAFAVLRATLAYLTV